MGKEYKVEYEGLHLICFHCGRFGHRKDHCPEGLLKINPADAHPEMAVPEGSMAVAHHTTTEDGKQDPAIKGDVGENVSRHVEVELTKEETNFGPWMIAKNPFRRKFVPRNVDKDSINQQSSYNRLNKGPIVKPKGSPTSSSPSPTPSRITAMASDKELMRKKEEEILRIMSWKQKEMWNAYVAGKSADEVLNQFVHTPSDELVAFANSVRPGQRRSDELQPDPPDPAKTVNCKIDGTPIFPSGPTTDFALVIDEAPCSTV
ncbi:hypothetical protein RIF29_05581 [Crotalaria pallida]|uniref:CCHC-type domain-containing protein n=1 Tax=Crotalaria pallida TaxID=3830 RepID=A0AAN9J3N5_CROPI